MGAPLPITLTTLVTNRADGGSGYSAPVRVTARPRRAGPSGRLRSIWQNPAPTQNPANSHGAGYPTTGYFVLPADYVGAGRRPPAADRAARAEPTMWPSSGRACTLMRRGRPAPTPRRVLSLPAGRGCGIAPMTAMGNGVFAGLQPGLPAVLALDLLVTDGTSGGSGYSAPVELTVSENGRRCRASGGGGPGAEPAVRGRAGRLRRAGLPGLRLAGGRSPPGGLRRRAGGPAGPAPRNRPARRRQPEQRARRAAWLDLGGGSGGDAATATPAPGQDQASCEALGGRWGPIGLTRASSATSPPPTPASDASSSADCEGTCLAELTQDELDAGMRGNKVVHAAGKCSAWRIVVGCVPMVEDGVLRPICID